MTERHGIEIDYCPKCRGVWLDRGELDKLIERGSQAESATTPPPPSAPPPQADARHYDDRRRYDDDDNDRRYPRKRKSFLGDIFDFG